MQKSALSLFHPAVSDWFRSALGKPTAVQERGFKAIHKGHSALLIAPTGSGKTLAAFLAAIDRLMWEDVPERGKRCRVLYISPLKALATDIERNLRAPIIGIAEAAKRRDEIIHIPTVDIRTGDTSAADRVRIKKTPPDILITTPESLFLVLTSQARSILSSVETIIIDEVHSVVPTKRGAHLALSLERLEHLREGKTEKPTQRIALSATQNPVQEVAELAFGFQRGLPRPVEIIETGEKKSVRINVELPDESKLPPKDAARIEDEVLKNRSQWPAIHARIHELIETHRSTMVFVNSRGLAERLSQSLNDLSEEPITLAHHGSLAHKNRALIEDRLKRGDLKSIVATSSLELGIDVGAVDLVVQVEAPASIASAVQRLGRACHNVGGTPEGVLIPKHRADILACAAAVPAILDQKIESTRYPRNPLDVLAQQIVAIAAIEPVHTDALFDLVRAAAPFKDLPRPAFEGVLDMLSGHYPSTEFAGLRARVTYHRRTGLIEGRKGSQHLAIANAGTIPDRGLYGVFLYNGESETGGRRVGELDEEMVFELREKEVFLLGASSWRAEKITHDRVLVTPAFGEPGRMPFWHGDRPGRSLGFGRAIGNLARTLAQKKSTEATKLLRSDYHLDKHAAEELATFVEEQKAATEDVPSDRVIVIERFLDELGDLRVCILTPFGIRVHAPWAIATAAMLRKNDFADIDLHYTDDGIVFRIPATDSPLRNDAFIPRAEQVEQILTDAIANTSLFAARFRECAARALLLPRRHPHKRTPLWAQRKRGSDLLAVAAHYPSFPILLETYRECLQDVFDLPGLIETLKQIQSRTIRIRSIETRSPSPFAANVLFAYVANFLYDADTPLAERRAQALRIDHTRLAELLGSRELRELLDPEIIAAYEEKLQRRSSPARHPDGVCDLLLELGDLTKKELEERVTEPEQLPNWLRELAKEGRICEIRIAKSVRYAAVEDMARLRDALGVVVPRGVPSSLLQPTTHALRDLLIRYAKTHAPFTLESASDRLGISAATVRQELDALVRTGHIIQGEFLPQGTGSEFCDPGVLRTLRQRSLAKLREQIQPAPREQYAQFLLDWHGIGERRRGADALLTAIAQLEGTPLIASMLESEILPSRIEGYEPWQLDMLCAGGQLVWRGVESLGSSDGKIALYLASSHPPSLSDSVHAQGELAGKIRELLQLRGAMFFPDIASHLGGFPAEILEALWDMVWAGEVTNDTLEPLRSRFRGETRKRARPDRNSFIPRLGQPGSEGRWSLVHARAQRDARTDTEDTAAIVHQLLQRHGVFMRESVRIERIPGGFSAVYEVLKAMEQAGTVRRGYFVEGRGGTQFAMPGAEDRLRAIESAKTEPAATLKSNGDSANDSNAPKTVIVAAADPANAYGGALDWPEAKGTAARPQRSAGALVVLHGGKLLAWVGRSETSLLTFVAEEEPTRSREAKILAQALARLPSDSGRRALLISTINGDAAHASDLAATFAAAGFVRTADGLLCRAETPDRHARPRDLPWKSDDADA